MDLSTQKCFSSRIRILIFYATMLGHTRPIRPTSPTSDILAFSVADPGCLSLIRIFSIPDRNLFNPGSRIRIKELQYFSPKKKVSKHSEIWPGLFFYPGSWFFTHPGSRGQKGSGSRIRLRNTANNLLAATLKIKRILTCILILTLDPEPFLSPTLDNMCRNRSNSPKSTYLRKNNCVFASERFVRSM